MMRVSFHGQGRLAEYGRCGLADMRSGRGGDPENGKRVMMDSTFLDDVVHVADGGVLLITWSLACQVSVE